MMSMRTICDRVNLVHDILQTAMKKDTHYGTVPGCGSKQVLLKPGADMLAMAFKLVPQFSVTRTDCGDMHREYDVTCSMYSADGVLLGQGVGSASTMEKKYAHAKANPADVYNTVLKIAKKRAHIDATLTVTGAADILTQDLIEDEEMQREPIQEPKAKATVPKAATKSTPPPADGDIVTGMLTGVEEIPFKKKDGSESFRFALVVDGVKYGTFSQTIADEATQFIDQQVRLTFSVSKDGKFKNAEGIELA